MTRDQILLLQLIMGKALDAALTKVTGMDEVEVKAAIDVERAKTESLLEAMRKA